MARKIRQLISKRWFKWLVLAIVLCAAFTAYAGRAGWRYVKTNPNFCSTCHLMERAHTRWETSAHKNVACQTCHPANVFEEMALGWAAMIERPDEVRPHTKVDVRVCRSCHVTDKPGWKQISNTPGHKAHVVERELNCLECHARELHRFKADTEQCKRCHGKDRLKLRKMADLHCLGCHDFKGEFGPRKSLRADKHDCRRCHAAAEGEAPEIVKLGHPEEKGKAAPVWKGHEDCLGCHKPHDDPIRVPADCLRCHKSLLEGGAHLRDERLTDCLECHPPHEPKSW